MLKFYLTTVAIWMIIIYCTAAMFENAIDKKLATLPTYKENKKSSLFKKFRAHFLLSAVPIVRVTIPLLLIWIAICSQEDFDKMMKITRENNN